VTRLARGLIGLLLLAALLAGSIALFRTGFYGLTIFIVFPLLLGGLTSWVFRPETASRAVLLGGLAPMCAALSFLVLGLEGLFCIGMTLPLVMPLGAFGGWLVYRAGRLRLAASGGVSLLLLLPGSLIWDTHAQPPLFAVRTAIEIAAPPERVWKHVVSFSELPPPSEWYFRAGVAYPKRARIVGTGPSAVRYCEFSTGPFVEPIEVWDEPRLLKFRVTENPPPLHEWSPYANVLPRHHGYLISKQGQFRLIPLPGNRTLLEGTTWYQHGLWPAPYWRWWSDAIIHRIHLRVLNHIRTLAETTSPTYPAQARSSRQRRSN
jgi:hypothetical protein